MKIIFYFFMFKNVPGCSGMFRNVPCSGFYLIDARAIHMHPKIFESGFFLWPDTAFVHTYPVNTAYETATFSILPQMLSRVDIFEYAMNPESCQIWIFF